MLVKIHMVLKREKKGFRRNLVFWFKSQNYRNSLKTKNHFKSPTIRKSISFKIHYFDRCIDLLMDRWAPNCCMKLTGISSCRSSGSRSLLQYSSIISRSLSRDNSLILKHFMFCLQAILCLVSLHLLLTISSSVAPAQVW